MQNDNDVSDMTKARFLYINSFLSFLPKRRLLTCTAKNGENFFLKINVKICKY